MTDPLYILTVLSLLLAASEWLVRRTVLRHLGTALLVILLTAVAANLGLLPSGSTEAAPVPVYDGIFAYVAPLSIFWLLLRVSLRDLLAAGLPVLLMFCVGALGTVAGVLVGMRLIDAPATIGPTYRALGGMFTGTYTGGSVNFNAVALHYGVLRDGVLYGGAVVVDNIITAVWMVVTLALPRLLQPLWPARHALAAAPREVLLGIEDDTETVHPIDLGLVLALGLGALWLSNLLAEALARLGTSVPAILILTTLALLAAQWPPLARLRGARLLGMFSVYLFLAVVGAFCDVGALGQLEQLGPPLLLFAATTVLVHGAITVVIGRLANVDPAVVAVTSQANVGGSTTALALARSLGRDDLVLPAILVGSFGNAVGTFLGFWASELLLPLLF